MHCQKWCCFVQETSSYCRSCRSFVSGYAWERRRPHANPWPYCSSLKHCVEQEQQSSTLTPSLHPSPLALRQGRVWTFEEFSQECSRHKADSEETWRRSGKTSSVFISNQERQQNEYQAHKRSVYTKTTSRINRVGSYEDIIILSVMKP